MGRGPRQRGLEIRPRRLQIPNCQATTVVRIRLLTSRAPPPRPDPVPLDLAPDPVPLFERCAGGNLLVLLCQLRRNAFGHGHELSREQLLGRLTPQPIDDAPMHLRQGPAGGPEGQGRAACPRGSPLSLLELLPHQETVRQHHQHTVPVETGPQPALILVPAQQFLGFLVKPLHPVPAMRVLHHPHQRRMRPEVAPVVASLAVAADLPRSASRSSLCRPRQRASSAKPPPWPAASRCCPRANARSATAFALGGYQCVCPLCRRDCPAPR